MTRPGTVITSRDSAPPRVPPTDTAVWFVAGLTEKGPTTPTLVQSLQAFRRIFGERVSYSVLSDCVETFFREGGSKCYVSRVVGAVPVAASVDLSDGTSATLKVKAASVGEWGNALNVEVEAGSTGGTFVLVISHDDDGELERSPDLADTAAAIAWAESSDYVRCEELAGSGDPSVVAATPLVGGDDDRDTVTDTHRTDALARFTRELGPGQVSIPGSTSSTVHQALLQHAADRNRKALLDVPDTASVSTLKTTAAAVRALGDLAREGAFFGPWAKIAGVVPGTTRTVPYSAVQAGLIARVDAAGNPNVPAAGEQGRPQSVVGLAQEWTSDADREALNDAGVNIARIIYGEVRTYGYRTVAAKDAHPLHWQLANVRLDMHVAAKAEAIAERHLFRQIDGKGVEAAAYGGELAAMLAPLYRLGALYGETADDAFRVDTGPAVNTPESIAEGRLRAVIALRRSPFAELAEVEVVKTAVTDAV